jgi:hypothetical protein
LAGGATLVALVAVVPVVVAAQEVDGFGGYIQSGTCAAPTDDLRVELDGEGDNAIAPFVAKTGADDETVEIGYYGAPGVPGFGFSAIYTDEQFSLVITGTDDTPVACGDLLQPDHDRFGEAGIAVVQLLPRGDSAVQGVAVIDREPLQRELDMTPTRVRVVLSTDDEVATVDPADGFDGYIQGGRCDDPGDRVRVQLESRGDHDVEPFLAEPSEPGEPVTVAFYGSAGAPGFGLAAVYTDQVFSLVITDTDRGDPVACGDLLQPDDDDFADAGVAVVQLRSISGPGVQGFALVERVAVERELDVTPTRVRILMFAPPVEST